MTYQFVQCPNFVQKATDGSVSSIQCKLCGTVIADTIERVIRYETSKAGAVTKVVERKLTRLSNYREIKIAFEDPSYFHITHGCSNCMSMTLPPVVLSELHAADQEESPDGYTDKERAQQPVAVAILQEDQSGIT